MAIANVRLVRSYLVLKPLAAGKLQHEDLPSRFASWKRMNTGFESDQSV